jgi:hypothetical protein
MARPRPFSAGTDVAAKCVISAREFSVEVLNVMKRMLVTVAALALVVLLPSLATAGPILQDPIIGVRGLDFGDSAPITDPSPQAFGTCNVNLGLPSAYLCSDYEITLAYTGGIFSVDLTFFDNGTPLPVGLLALDPLSGFGTLTVLDAFTIRLSGGTGPGGSLACGSSVGATTSVIPCTSLNDAVVFISDQGRSNGPFTVALSAVNQASEVPEPGTLLLLGTGVASIARRQLRRKIA